MRIVFMGTPIYSVLTLEALLAQPDIEVVGVYTPPDRPRGRGRAVESSPVKAAAQALSLPVWQPDSLRSAAAQRELAALEPDVAVVAAYGKLLPPAVLALPRYGCLNIHPSLLPKYRGPSPVATAILDGVAATGVTLMLLNAGMDTGPILAQREYRLDGAETAASLTEALFRVGTELLVENLPAWTAGRLEAVAQDDSQATVTRKLERADGLADWSLSALELARRQRAFTPWPGLSTYWQGKLLRLVEVVPPAQPEAAGVTVPAAPGEVISLPSREIPLGIGTGQGVLGLKQVQLEGRRATTAAEFLRGYPQFPGSRL